MARNSYNGYARSARGCGKCVNSFVFEIEGLFGRIMEKCLLRWQTGCWLEAGLLTPPLRPCQGGKPAEFAADWVSLGTDMASIDFGFW
jgi:hypothetical protein